MSLAVASGDCESVRQVLRRAKPHAKLHRALEFLQLVQAKVPGSESERGALRYSFRAMRIWHSCSPLFVTLNPHDIRSPLAGCRHCLFIPLRQLEMP